jgi:hypothetical protein
MVNEICCLFLDSLSEKRFWLLTGPRLKKAVVLLVWYCDFVLDHMAENVRTAL